MQAAAAMTALGGALLLIRTDRRWPDVQEAQIGALFVLAASGVILLLAKNPHGSAHLRDLLTWQILWVRYAQPAIPLVATVFTLALLWTWRGRLPQPCVRAIGRWLPSGSCYGACTWA